jgi:hypothetical protein
MKSLDQVQAAAALRNKALQPLQELKTKVAALSSIPKILYFQDQGGNLLDDAMLIIESASQKRATVLEDSGGTTTEKVLTTGAHTAAPKPSRVIWAAELSPTIYLETPPPPPPEAEVESYVAKLKAELLATIKAGQRARIQ